MPRDVEKGDEERLSPDPLVFPAMLVDESPAELVPSRLVDEDNTSPAENGDSQTTERPKGVLPVTAESVEPDSAEPLPPTRPERMTIRRLVGNVWHATVVSPLRLASVILLLAIISAIPVLQLAVLGYLLEVTGRLGRGGRLRDCLPSLESAGRLVLALGAVFLVALPIRLTSYWAYAAELLDPNNPQALTLRIVAALMVAFGAVYLAWAWLRGGRLRHYLWPQPIRFVKQIWRPSLWNDGVDRLWNLLASFQLPRLMWLGFRGAIGALAWIAVPALLIIGATRNGETGLAGLVGILGLALMGFVVIYLPMLQARFATEERMRAMFQWREIRRSCRKAPIAFWLATCLTLLLAVPLYLLKIEVTPKEVVWLPSLLFIAFMLPAHVISGVAMGRAEHREAGRGWFHFLIRMTCRLLTLPFVVGYLMFLYFAQLTSWDGMATWLQQHAFLVPVPFTGI